MGYKSLTNYNRPDTMRDKQHRREMQLSFREVQEEYRREQREFLAELEKIKG